MTPSDSTTLSLTPEQAAQRLGITERTILSYARDGKIEHVSWHHGGRGRRIVLFTPTGIAKFLKKHTQPADK